jgi:Astacin (Peptidase family M12A)
MIFVAMKHISKRSCIKFEPKTSEDKNYVYIENKSGCRTVLGFQNVGRQYIVLDEHYCPVENIVHEFLHILGLFHMHESP